MKITDIRPVIVHVNQRGDWLFVLVETDAGLTGLGEASHSSSDAMLLAQLGQWAPRLVGQDPRQIEAIRMHLRSPNLGRVQATAISAIEQALWDILGQHLGVPIHVLLGGAVRERIRLYANINRHVRDRSPQAFARAAATAVEEGFTAIKLAPFDEVRGVAHRHTGSKAAWRMGVERVRAVRAAIGDEVELAVDCHSRFDASEALMVARELESCRLFWFEEPVHHRLVADLRHITAQISVPTASAESLFGMEAFAPFLSERVVDVIMPDVKHDGGILETREIAAAARMHGILVAPHNPSGPVASAASAQLCATLPNFYILEHAWGEADWRADLLDPPERIEEGHLLLPQGPGLGHRLNPEMVAKQRVTHASGTDSSTALPVR